MGLEPRQGPTYGGRFLLFVWQIILSDTLYCSDPCARGVMSLEEFSVTQCSDEEFDQALKSFRVPVGFPIH